MKTVQIQFDINIYNDDDRDEYWYQEKIYDFLESINAPVVNSNIYE